MKIRITVTGLTAASIERAERASIYGVNGNERDCCIARRNCNEAIEKALKAAGIDWNWLQVYDAHSISTDGLKTPYLAEIYAGYSPV